jgi:hypothetical protein
MDINSININWQTFIAYASAIIAIASVVANIRFRVVYLEQNDKRQDNEIGDLKKSDITSQRNIALLLQKTDNILEQIKLMRSDR